MYFSTRIWWLMLVILDWHSFFSWLKIPLQVQLVSKEQLAMHLQNMEWETKSRYKV
ncbi:hypothetical protein LINGRAHAP2_LOCUS5198, partial [Linum grandiflorum]